MDRRLPRALVIDDDRELANALAGVLRGEWDVVGTRTPWGSFSATDETPYDLVLERLPPSYPRLYQPLRYAIALSPNDPLFEPGSRFAGATRLITGGNSEARHSAWRFGAAYVDAPINIQALAQRFASEREKALLYRHDEIDAAIEAIRPSLLTVNDELLAFLAANPNALRELHWRRFEELVAELLQRSGFQIQLQRGTKDFGVDIIAANHRDIENIVMLVQCKQVHRHVSVEVVRQLYGVVQQRQATVGLVATTSYFTRPAQEFQQRVAATLLLRDFTKLTEWLKQSCG